MSRREQQRQETRQRLFDAALEVFRRDGVAAARIEDIAQRAGVSRATFYFHFPTREAVLEELLEGAEAEFAATIEALPAETPLEAVLDATAAAMASRWSVEPKLWTDVALTALRTTAQRVAAGENSGVRRALGQRFAAAVARGEVRGEVPAQALADFYLASAMAVAISWATAPTMPLEIALRGAAVLFLEGARAKR